MNITYTSINTTKTPSLLHSHITPPLKHNRNKAVIKKQYQQLRNTSTNTTPNNKLLHLSQTTPLTPPTIITNTISSHRHTSSTVGREEYPQLAYTTTSHHITPQQPPLLTPRHINTNTTTYHHLIAPPHHTTILHYLKPTTERRKEYPLLGYTADTSVEVV